MNSKHSQWNNSLPATSPAVVVKTLAHRAGAIAAGIATAGPLDAAAAEDYRRWIATGRHGAMQYLERHEPLRRNPETILPGARSVVCMAFPYRPAGGYHHPVVADYALGRDYHAVLRQRVAPVAEYLSKDCGAMARVCVDSAPLPERYWAVRAGVGFIGLNHQLIIPGAGSGVVLCEIITTLALPQDTPLKASCEGCGRCLQACPGHALLPDGSFDATRCLSYLTIEHRGPWPRPMEAPRRYGCDVCQRVCPHNAGEPPEPLEEFIPDPRLVALDANAMAHLTSGDWRRLSAGTARTRLRYADYLRNMGR